MPRVSDEHLAARRRQILDAAFTCFAREGLHRTTMQDIFREAGLSPGAVYRYFPSKDAIFEALAESTFSEIAGRFLAETPRTLADAALAPYRLMTEFPVGTLDERARLILQVWAEALRTPAVRERALRPMEFARSAFEARIRAEQAAGTLSADLDPDGLARAIVAFFQGFLVQHALYGHVELEPYRAAVRALVDGLSA